MFKVDFLELGDAFIFPDGKKLKIQKNAVMDTLYNARILANRITKIHQFSDVTVEVKGRNEFNGNGLYFTMIGIALLRKLILETSILIKFKPSRKQI